jgi:hypothetical protein
MRILLLAQFFPPNIGCEEPSGFNIASTLAERGTRGSDSGATHG